MTLSHVVVPAISILGVFKWVLLEHSEPQAIQASAVMQRGHVVDLDTPLAIAAAHQSFLHTMDSDFQGLPDVVLIEKVI